VRPGDVVVVLQREKHEVFQRCGCDLGMVHQISLTEALCGLVFVVQHLDGRKIVIRSPPGMVIEPGNPPLPASCSVQYCLLPAFFF